MDQGPMADRALLGGTHLISEDPVRDCVHPSSMGIDPRAMALHFVLLRIPDVSPERIESAPIPCRRTDLWGLAVIPKTSAQQPCKDPQCRLPYSPGPIILHL